MKGNQQWIKKKEVEKKAKLKLRLASSVVEMKKLKWSQSSDKKE